MREVTHKPIVQFHKSIAEAHNDLNGFYRFNWNEIAGQFRSGVSTPALLLESHSSNLNPNKNKTTHFNHRQISFLLVDFTGKADAFDKQEEVLDHMENIGLDVGSYLVKCHNDRDHFLFGKFEASTFRMEKVGPIFDNMYGWNVLFELKNHEPMCYDETKWTWLQP